MCIPKLVYSGNTTQQSEPAGVNTGVADVERSQDASTKNPTRYVSILENPSVLLTLSCADFTGACLFTYGCVMFIPSNMTDQGKFVEGLNLFALGIIVNIILLGVFCRETLKMVGARSMEFAEVGCSMLALVLFILGLVLFYPSDGLPQWVKAVYKPFMKFCTSIAPEYLTHVPGSETKDPGPQGFPLTGAMFFLLGSLLFCLSPMIHMINMSNENLKDQARDVINQLLKGIAGVLFMAGTMFLVPGVGCNYDAVALAGYLFIGASMCFVMTAVSDIIAAALLVAQARRSSDYIAMRAVR